uniref:Uncharacterized protein n=2 Tax=Meloidogyne TaxID=189290 RepID=A0A915NZX5_9BILA
MRSNGLLNSSPSSVILYKNPTNISNNLPLKTKSGRGHEPSFSCSPSSSSAALIAAHGSFAAAAAFASLPWLAQHQQQILSENR